MAHQSASLNAIWQVLLMDNNISHLTLTSEEKLNTARYLHERVDQYERSLGKLDQQSMEFIYGCLLDGAEI